MRFVVKKILFTKTMIHVCSIYEFLWPFRSKILIIK